MQILGTIASSKQVVYISAMDSISTTTLAATSSTITFSSIPQTYDQLQLRIFARNSATSSAQANIYVNNDTTDTNYRSGTIEAVVAVTFFNTLGEIPARLYVTGTESNASYYSPTIVDIYDYSITTKYNPSFYLSSAYDTGSSSTGREIVRKSATMWKTGFQQVTSLSISLSSSHFLVGSTFSLYGINVR